MNNAGVSIISLFEDSAQFPTMMRSIMVLSIFAIINFVFDIVKISIHIILENREQGKIYSLLCLVWILSFTRS